MSNSKKVNLATVTAITTTYAGEFAGDYIAASLLSASTIDDGGLTVKANISFKEVIKKLATGKGNADKEKMYDKFYEETGVNMMEALDQTTLNNPVTDIVDSFYIARTGYETTISKIKQLKSIFSPK